MNLLAPAPILIYTDRMRSIDPQWTGLAEGYRTMQNLQERLGHEFGRALEAGHRESYRRRLEEWQRKRRVFFALLALAPLSVIMLCVAAFKIKDVACVIAYWAVLIVIILVTLVISGWGFIRDATNRPQFDAGMPQADFLEVAWWENMKVRDAKESKTRKVRGEEDPGDIFINLPDSFLEHNGVIIGESGIWMFVTRAWKGTIIRDELGWKKARGRKKENFPGEAPDAEWTEKKKAIAALIAERLPHCQWLADRIQGGVVFIDRRAQPDKTRIHGNSAAYGSVSAWMKRMEGSPTLEGFPLVLQLEMLDALNPDRENGSSAKEEAENLYRKAAQELRQSIEKMVG